MRTLLHIANPFHKRGFYALPHLLVIAAAVVVVYLAGFFSGVKYGESYFRAHYIAPQPVPHVSAPVPVVPRALPTAATVNLSLYPAVGDQGPLGACAAWASTYALSYSYRVAHPLTGLRRFSPRYAYNHYSDTYSGGQDGGSWPDQDLEQVNTTGMLRWTAMPYGGTGWGGHPGYAIDDPQPAIDAHGRATSFDAAKQRFPITIHAISGFSAGGGQGLVDAIHAAIAAGHPVMIALPVYPEFDNATNTGGLIDVPQPGESSRGGHEIVILGYDAGKHFASGPGGELVQNQWNTWWGDQGRGWLSDAFVRQYVYGAEYITIGGVTAAHQAPGSADGFSSHLHTAPPIPPSVPHHVGRSAWYVHNVRLTTGQDVSGLFNAWGNRYHVSPVGLAATAGTESGLSPNAERWAGGLDNSCGLMQVIVTNVEYYAGLHDALSACRWEENPGNAIYLAARIYADDFSYQNNCVLWWWAYGMYNAGAGLPCSWYYNPSSLVVAHDVNFRGWWNYANAVWASGSPPPPPKPKPFPRARWDSYRLKHHEKTISPFWHGKLSFAASVWRKHAKECGGITRVETWFGPQRGRRVGFEKDHFQGCALFTWPTKRGWNPLVHRHRWKA